MVIFSRKGMEGDGIWIGLFAFFAIAFKGYGKERIFEERYQRV